MSLKNIIGVNWILLRVQSGSEDKIKKDIDEALEMLKKDIELKKAEEVDSEDLVVYESLLSVEIPKVMGDKKDVEKCAFPGYAFVKIDIKNKQNSEKIVIIILSFLRSVLKKISIISSKNTGDIRILTDKEFERMIEKIKETSEKKKSSKQIQKDSHVRIINGPFSSTEATVVSVDYDKGYVKLFFNLFGHGMSEECKIEDVKIINQNEQLENE